MPEPHKNPNKLMLKHVLLKIFGSVLLILFSVGSSFGQGSSKQITGQVEDILNEAEAFYGADDRLINGRYYVPKQPFAHGHPYYLTDDWVKTILYVKGITFDDVEIKFNIEDDILILKRQYKQGLIVQIILNNSLVDSLRINDHLFVNSTPIFGSHSPGYLEFIQKGEFVSYLKHEVNYKDEITPQMPQGKYLDPKSILYIYNDMDFVRISTKKELLAYFSPHEKEIKKFMRKNKIGFKKATKEQFIKLLNYCDGL